MIVTLASDAPSCGSSSIPMNFWAERCEDNPNNPSNTATSIRDTITPRPERRLTEMLRPVSSKHASFALYESGRILAEPAKRRRIAVKTTPTCDVRLARRTMAAAQRRDIDMVRQFRALAVTLAALAAIGCRS